MAVLTLSTIIEADTGDGVDGAAASEALPTADRGIDIQRIELHAAADPADALGGQQRRAAAEEGIEHKIATSRAIEDCVGNQGDGFYGRGQGSEVPFLSSSPELGEACVRPDV